MSAAGSLSCRPGSVQLMLWKNISTNCLLITKLLIDYHSNDYVLLPTLVKLHVLSDIKARM